MKYRILNLLGLMSALTITTTTNAEEQIIMNQTASYIEMNAKKEQTNNLADFLTGAAKLVKETEPGTELWFALRNAKKLAIFDIFTDENGRQAHFAGAVASALKENAARLVDGGWDNGVVANINNASVLSIKPPADLYTATTATYIKLKAAPGQANALKALLTAAGPIVTETEPKTLYWVALQIDENNFAIFDIFADNSAREAHFAGQVANLLKEKSADLVEGGWEEGVVANVHNYEILAIK